MEDLFSLIKILELKESGEYDLAIIDCAPTGSTLQLLSLADILQWYMEKFYNIEKKIALAIKPITEKLIKAPMPNKEVYSNVESIYRRLIKVRDLLTDPKQSSIRLVANPEKIVIRETQRAYTYLCLYGFPVDAVIVNRVLPKNLAKGYFKDWVRLQKEYLGQIEAAFSPLPILTTPMYPREMIGPGDLVQMAESAYGSLKAEEVLWEGRPFVLSGEPGCFRMDISLPGVERAQIDLWAKADELIITVGGFQRNLILPRALDEHIGGRSLTRSLEPAGQQAAVGTLDNTPRMHVPLLQREEEFPAQVSIPRSRQ